MQYGIYFPRSLFSTYLHDREAGVQISRKVKIEENKSHIAREIIALTSLSYGQGILSQKKNITFIFTTQRYKHSLCFNLMYISFIKVINFTIISLTTVFIKETFEIYNAHGGNKKVK